MALKKVDGSVEWAFKEPFACDDAFAYDNTVYCPPMQGAKKVTMGSGGSAVHNPYQRPQVLLAHFVRRFSTANGVVAELTGGSGTLAAACANTDDLRGRTGEGYRRAGIRRIPNPPLPLAYFLLNQSRNLRGHEA